jgi:predicted P-loop ATPase
VSDEHLPNVVALTAALPRAQRCDLSSADVAPATPSPQSHVAKILAWGLDRNGNGAALPNLNNAVKILEHDPACRNLVRFDEFLQRFMTGDQPREWTDADDVNLTLHMQRNVGVLRMGRDTVSQAVMQIAYSNPIDCRRAFLDALPSWDRIERCDAFFCDVFGARESAYTRAVGGNFWKALIARALDPGCKVDNVVVLEGAQGLRKSSALAAIVGEAWFAEAGEEITSKDFFVAIQGKWITEIAEIDAFSRADVTTIKRVVSCRVDRFRPPYGRTAKDHPRQGVFVATTNKDDWNRDETGARRFWPIRCNGDVRIELIRDNRLQLFSEAQARCKAGEFWWEMPEGETSAEQEARREGDVWEAPIAHWLIGRGDKITIAEVLTGALGLEIGRITRKEQVRVSKILRGTLGWQAIDGWLNGKKAKYWMKSEEGRG